MFAGIQGLKGRGGFQCHCGWLVSFCFRVRSPGLGLPSCPSNHSKPTKKHLRVDLSLSGIRTCKICSLMQSCLLHLLLRESYRVLAVWTQRHQGCEKKMGQFACLGEGLRLRQDANASNMNAEMKEHRINIE